MAAPEADQFIRALHLARECIALGARLGTASQVTGLRSSMLRTYFFRHGGSINGRRPESSEWVHWGNLCLRAEASEFASIFSTLHEQYRCLPADALVIAYRMYAERCPRKPTVSFDRAFALVCDLLGIWLRKEARLAMHRCPQCRARYVAEIGAPPPRESGCVFCHLLQRYPLDARVQAHYVARRADLPTILARPDGAGPEKAA
ncbi:FlhC family transcriptional regulator [Massilia sp. Root418]|uniref:FlhC family transcriptional regulator n=1 Tax=Massilia sp. Root418 TaxID=1736532 RepID=UPI0006FA530A|nr:FlhC family transcriptional regulator [Massilia sp. Root418]